MPRRRIPKNKNETLQSLEIENAFHKRTANSWKTRVIPSSHKPLINKFVQLTLGKQGIDKVKPTFVSVDLSFDSVGNT